MMKFTIIALAAGILAVPALSEQPVAAPAAEAPARPAEMNPTIAAFLKPSEPAAGDNELRKKLKERHNSAARLLEMRLLDFKSGRRDVTSVYEAARMAADAKMDMAENADQRKVVLEQSLEVAKVFEAHLQKQVDAGIGSKSDLERARYARLTIEVMLLKAAQ